MNAKETVSYFLIQIAAQQKIHLEKLMSEIGLHAGQVIVLESLWKADRQSQADLVRSLSVTPPTIYNLVIRLSKSGFVELKKDATDARLIRVCLSQKGIDIKAEVESQWIKLEEMLFSKLSTTEKSMFLLLLDKLKTVEES